jgi:hypothetical protein
MFKIFMLLIVTADPTPQLMQRDAVQFSTQSECDAALQAEDARIETKLTGNGWKRGKDYTFTLRCVAPPGNPV